MSEESDTSNFNLPAQIDSHGRFLSIEISQWEPLGCPAELLLSPHRTILVGRNGSGKSILMEGMHKGAQDPFSLPLTPRGPQLFRCLFQVANKLNFGYEHSYRLDPSEDPDLEENSKARIIWREKCWIEDIENNEEAEIWSIHDGVLKFLDEDNERHHSIPPATSLLGILQQGLQQKDASFQLLKEDFTPAMLLASLNFAVHLTGIRKVNAGLPRKDALREEVMIALAGDGGLVGKRRSPLLRASSTNVRRFAKRIIDWHEQNRSLFEEFKEIGQRIGLFDEIHITVYQPSNAPGIPDRIATVIIDGVNIGLVADGTLRIIEILIALLDSRNTTTLLIEEPEMGVHPGLLQKLLAEIDAYTRDKQVIISTHSPQVVSWGRPEELRLIERKDSKTRVRALTEPQVNDIINFLNDLGTLGDYVYGGALEDE